MIATNKIAIFSIVFVVAYAAIYAVCTEVNLPLLTYHPVTGEIGPLYQPPGRGPAMYWYGWMLTALIGAIALALIATVIPEQWLQRGIIFGAALAVLYLVLYTLALLIYDKATVELEFLKDRRWSVVAAAVGAAALGLFAPTRWTQRVWPGWVWAVPLGSLAVLGYYLTPYFTR
jgi:hypothetical protein